MAAAVLFYDKDFRHADENGDWRRRQLRGAAAADPTRVMPI